ALLQRHPARRCKQSRSILRGAAPLLLILPTTRKPYDGARSATLLKAIRQADSQRSRLLGAAHAAVDDRTVDILGREARRIQSLDVGFVPIDDVLALLVERVQQLAVDRRAAERIRGTQIQVRLAARAQRIVRNERVGAEVTEPDARLPRTGHGREAELPGVLDRPIDPPAAVDLVDVARAAARVDRVDAEPVDRPPERDELVAAPLGRTCRLDG